MKKLILSIALLLAASVGYSQETTRPLQLTIKSDKQVYGVGEEIELEATFENKSDKEIILFLCKERPICHLIPMNKIGGDRSIDLSCEICPTVNPKVETIYIKPDSLIMRNIKIDLSKWGFGSYNLYLLYNFPNIPLDFKHLPNQGIFNEKLFSNTITIEVVEKKNSENQSKVSDSVN